MKASEKQINWAKEIIIEHREVLAIVTKDTEEKIAKKIAKGQATEKLIVKLNEYKKIAELDWANVDASKVLDMRDWAKREEDIGFGQVNKAKFNLPNFYNVMGVVFGMSSNDINEFFGV